MSSRELSYWLITRHTGLYLLFSIVRKYADHLNMRDTLTDMSLVPSASPNHLSVSSGEKNRRDSVTVAWVRRFKDKRHVNRR